MQSDVLDQPRPVRSGEELDASKLEDAILALEPNVPWKRPLLQRRAKLYEATNNPRAELARRELALFLRYDSKARPPPVSR